MTIGMIEPVGGHGGMNYYDINLCKEISKRGTKVILFTCDETREKSDIFKIIKSFKRIYGSESSVLRGLRFLRGLICSIYICKRKRVKIIHFHFFKISALEFICVVLAKLFIGKVVITIHDVESFANKNNRLFCNLVYSMCNKAIVHNNISKYELLRKGRIKENKVKIIPHGNYINNIHYIEKKIAKEKIGISDRNKFLILFFGQIKEVKGLDILIKSISILTKVKKNIEVIIAGKVWKDDFSKYRKMIKKLKVENYFILHIHYIPDKMVDYYFGACDLVILPYKKIYQSGVLLNAMSYKKAVLASDLPGMLEIIKKNINGYVFKVNNEYDLAKKLNYIIDNPNELRCIEKKAYDYVRKNHNWEYIGFKTNELYETLIKQGD